MQFVAVAVLTLLLVGVVSSRLFEDAATSDVQGATTIQVKPSSAGQSLQVRDAIGDPAPLGSPIQGAQGASQQGAAGDLQQPSTSDDLQPNAKLSDFPENL